MISTLFDRIAVLHPTLQGWCELDKAFTLAGAVLALRPTTIVEIGVFGGKSLLPMALACQAVGHGTLIAIDPWSATASTEGYDGEHAEWWGSIDHDEVYQKFMAATRDAGVLSRVQVVRQKSDDFEPPLLIDLVHLDGQHSDQAVRDVRRYASKVRVGGMIFTDDDDWPGGGPAEAVRQLLAMGFLKISRCGTGSIFQRVFRAEPPPV